jgi:hypothetical protein
VIRRCRCAHIPHLLATISPAWLLNGGRRPTSTDAQADLDNNVDADGGDDSALAVTTVTTYTTTFTTATPVVTVSNPCLNATRVVDYLIYGKRVEQYVSHLDPWAKHDLI